jgi:NAD(P)-dependent dehydrogenase (short-subunit alcohol dehydrogenase family)
MTAARVPAAPRRAALVTGASSGIGLALSKMLLAEGYALTMVARQPEKLEAAARDLAAGADINVVAGDLTDESVVREAVRSHAEHFQRLDVLVNSAGVGIAEPIGTLTTSRLDRQLSLNVRATALLCREGSELLVQAGREHRNALILNLASVVGKQGAAGFAAYSATKFAVVGLTQSLNQELGASGVKATALCPALVNTPMTDFIKDQVPAESMIQTSDIVEVARMLLGLSPGCVVPELALTAPGGALAFA